MRLVDIRTLSLTPKSVPETVTYLFARMSSRVEVPGPQTGPSHKPQIKNCSPTSKPKHSTYCATTTHPQKLRCHIRRDLRWSSRGMQGFFKSQHRGLGFQHHHFRRCTVRAPMITIGIKGTVSGTSSILQKMTEAVMLAYESLGWIDKPAHTCCTNGGAYSRPAQLRHC